MRSRRDIHKSGYGKKLTMDVSIWGAFIAGIISFVSPCVLPLVPPYLCYLAGVSMDELTADSGDDTRASNRVIASSAVFVAGFTTVFVILGATASIIGQVISSYIEYFGYAAGAAIIVMGLHFLGVFKIGFLYREARVHVKRKPAGLWGAYVMGLAFAFGWTPCLGPILAAILAVAGTSDTAAEGAMLLGVYSVGIGVPFIAAGAFAPVFMGFMRKFRRHLGTVEKLMGVMLVLTGVLFLSGQMQVLAFYLLEMFPALQGAAI